MTDYRVEYPGIRSRFAAAGNRPGQLLADPR
jgi:hypothetical protein